MSGVLTLKSWISVLALTLLFGCTSSAEPVIAGDITKVIVFKNYGAEKVAEIDDAETIHELVQRINEGKREDISEIVRERGPDGTLVFEHADGAFSFHYFSEHSPVAVIWSDDRRTYSIETNLFMDELVTH